jgi:hypothetical protein
MSACDDLQIGDRGGTDGRVHVRDVVRLEIPARPPTNQQDG